MTCLQRTEKEWNKVEQWLKKKKQNSTKKLFLCWILAGLCTYLGSFMSWFIDMEEDTYQALEIKKRNTFLLAWS